MNNTKVKIKKVKSIQDSKGITLIALIITIIILIILAGVTLNVLTGENGIINRAVKAKEDTENKGAEELLKIAVMSSMNIEEGSSEISIDKLNKNIKEINGIDENTVITEFPATVEINNKKYIITEKGEVLHNALLPIEYKELEYIESTGTQYIDTNVMPSENFKATISFKTKEILSEQYVLACSGGSNNRFYLITNNFDIGYGDYQHSTISFDKNTKYYAICTYTNGNQIIECNGKIINNANFTVSGKWNSSLKIFARDGSQNFRANVLLYYCKLEQEGTVVREYIPCYRKSDNKVGMYDLVENKFYSSKTGTEFIAGNENINGE